ncbi:uncharacterized protein Z519_02183 [Cladophialophora bantiana CBS 173.52]|uniref:EthD domain-containing protein n=1 Tax=Cladophialophora bantiana (strain ATCC 10958 / CBS 173.52 / CDC B-1940 / NIH 8579) TaxID=1442370 RepID=A0A0D2GEH5_CLAB1|nr:uncharacterized protein Z519_02183 [Cladophialophora bantiana CBS 173.52]KIW96792.1 hypothetical protein Z519_02183 [Cladophialophora bantiana CBS 173.52]
MSSFAFTSEIAFALYRPHNEEGPEWLRFRQGDHSGLLYKVIENPMGRPAPDDKTYLVISSQIRTTPEDANAGTLLDSKYADTEIRTYTLLEVYDPRGLGISNAVSPLILQAEASPADIKEFQDFYRVDHTVMMAKHPGYRRTALYQLQSVLKPAQQPQEPAPVLILHEFDTFDEVGGPITQASIVTPLATKVFGAVKSMISRGIQLESAGNK